MKAKKSERLGGGKQERSAAWVTQGELLRRALAWLIDEKIFAHLARHGNTSWKTEQLVCLAVLWAWSDASTLTGAFAQAYEAARQLFPSVAVTSYQGLMNALVTWTATLLPLLWQSLHGSMQRVGGAHWRIGRWLPLAVDGSRITTPRTQSNEAAFAARNYGRGKMARSRRKWKNKKARSKKLSQPVKPQLWLTLMWHMGLRMPWSWKSGPSNASERGHFLELVNTHVFPEYTLFCCDAGFIGYELWSAILARGHSFLIRVGGNVRLFRNLGTARMGRDVVFVWPNTAARRKQPPLMLRLLKFQGPRGTVYLVTNVLSEKELSARQAGQLYRLRWGVELQFRAYKQTFGRGTLRSRTAERAVVELDWSLLGLWMVQLLAVKEQLRVGTPPIRTSVSLALRVVQEAVHSWPGEEYRPEEWHVRLAAAVTDEYQRHGTKQARYRPHYKDPPTATAPKIVEAPPKLKKAYQDLSTAL